MHYPRFRSLVLTASLVSLIAPAAFSQDERDALRLSNLQPQGTARSIGFGSALGSIGGDFSSLAVNPAGIGIYRSSEMMITPSLTFSNTNSDYSGNSASQSGSHFSLGNIGIVATRVARGRRKEHSDWTAVSFGFGLNRMADFTRDYTYQGTNSTSSGSFVFENDANTYGRSGNGQIVYPADLGYESYLLDTTSGGKYVSVVNPALYPVRQTTTVHERGGISEMDLTLGGAYHDKLMLGATLGVPFVHYLRDKTFYEQDISGNTNNDFDYFRYTDNLKTDGTGINLKLGLIYKVNDYFRFGAAIHTPTEFYLTDVDNQSVTANTENFAVSQGASSVNTATAAENQYNYRITTPWRGVISGSGLFGKYGFFTVDYEYVDYSSSMVHFDQDNKDYETAVNNAIKSTYKGASNVRAGVEVRLQNLMLRAGFGYYGNPYQGSSVSAERLDFSGGIGFRFERTFIDLGFVHHDYKMSEQPYQLPMDGVYTGIVVPTATLNTGANNAVMTFGFKF